MLRHKAKGHQNSNDRGPLRTLDVPSAGYRHLSTDSLTNPPIDTQDLEARKCQESIADASGW
jgi:hypothetical protein